MSKFYSENADRSPARKTDDTEDRFNRFASDEFIREYERETGEQLKLKRLGTPFPDVVLERAKDRQEIGIEFVEVILSFINQEQSYFEKKYLELLYIALEDHRPRYKNVAITLQPSSRFIESLRPIVLPKPTRSEGKLLVNEFKELLSKHYSDLLTTYGGLLENLIVDGKQTCPELTKYFSAIILNPVEDGDPRKKHPDDPVITLPSVVYQALEIVKATENSLANKLAKGKSYETDFLVLHTLPTVGKPYSPITAVHGETIAETAKTFAAQIEEIKVRFREGWLLNAYITEGKKLYRLW